MDLTGRKLGKYEILELLGSGGMAEVYKGLDTRLERPVAIKVMLRHLANSKDFQTRFLREAKATANLQHPNIVNLIDFDKDEGLYFMVMEFIEGETIEDYLKGNSPLDLDEAVRIIDQLAAGLEYAHRKNMVHRDIKPANMMFVDGTRDRIVVTDFGIAKLLDEESMTMTGTMLGTPHYMAPEVVKGEAADQRADIYSMGTVLFEMVTGQPPYQADTPYGVLLKQANEPLPEPRSLNPDLPVALEEAIIRSLQKDPAERFQSVTEFRTALKDFDGTGMGPSFAATINQPSTIVPAVEVVASSSGADKNAKKEADADNSAFRRWLPLFGAIGGVTAIAALTLFLLSSFGGGTDDPTPLAEATAAPTAAAAVAEAEPTATDLPAPTEASVPEVEPSPTEPPPTNTPVVEPTEQVVGNFDFAVQPAFVCNIDFSLDSTSVRLELEDLQHPPGGTLYVAWLANSAGTELINLGIINSNRYFQANLLTPVEGFAPERFDRLILSAEDPDNLPDAPTNIILDGAIDPDTFEVQATLLTDYIYPGTEQYLLALQHSNLAAESLAANNLAEAQRHAEHTINILEGEFGENFGDLDSDGQAQNPGNGVGVATYLFDAAALFDASDLIDTDSPVFFAQKGIDVSLGSSQNEAFEAVNLALKIFAVDSAEEGQPIADSLISTVEAGINGRDFSGDGKIDTFDDEGGINMIQSLIVQWMEGSYFPDHRLFTNLDTIGTVRYLESNDNPLSAVEIDIYPVSMVDDPNTGYFVFLISNEGEEVVNLGRVTPENFRIRQQYAVEDISLGKFNTVVISVETLVEDQLPDGPNDVRFFAEIGSDELGVLLPTMVGVDGSPSNLGQMTFEADLARQHVDFMITALAENDLTLARRHAEHVINIMVGEAAAEFGDVDGNGTVENPSEDGTGVRTYNRIIANDLLVFDQNTLLNGRSKFYGEQVVPDTLENQQAYTAELLELVFKVLATDTVDEAGPIAGSANGAVNALLVGGDQDSNGVIDLRKAEGGILQLENLIYLLTERSFSNFNQ
ncbi:MAG: protein kinase [Chloroflexota bacterium]